MASMKEKCEKVKEDMCRTGKYGWDFFKTGDWVYVRPTDDADAGGFYGYFVYYDATTMTVAVLLENEELKIVPTKRIGYMMVSVKEKEDSTN